MKARDTGAVAALRSAIAAIDNAQAVPPSHRGESHQESGHVAGARAGMGSTEAQRRTLTVVELRAILTEQVSERLLAAQEYSRAGHDEAAARLRREAEILDAHLRPESRGRSSRPRLTPASADGFNVDMRERTGLGTSIANPPDRLPRGRHGLSLETVRASQRQRLLQAMLGSVAEQGYEATTVPHVVARARVSRNAFYELFNDKVDCFLVLCDELAEELSKETFDVDGAGDWREAIREGTARYLAWWQSRPLFARAYLVELPIAGTRALEQRKRAHEQFARRWEAVAAWIRKQRPGLAPLRPSSTRLLAWGIGGILADEVAAGRTAQLPALEDDIVWMIERVLAEPAQ